jgi:hypothetical protein
MDQSHRGCDRNAKGDITMAKSYSARAIAGNQTSATFDLYQVDNGPKLNRIVDLVVRPSEKLSKNGAAQTHTTNRELGLYKTHNAEWLDQTLKGFRVARPDGTAQIRVEVISPDFLEESDFNAADKY